MQEPRLSLPDFEEGVWTLFLDRDGVINRRIVGGYVTRVEELELLAGVPEAIAALSRKFRHTVVVTNQQGLAKGLYTEEALAQVHREVAAAVADHGGRIDRFYYCPHMKGTCDCRKPEPGMAKRAKEDFASIDFHRSVMVGDSESDMEFGRRLGMKVVWVGREKASSDVDLHIDSLAQLPAALGLE